jgi:phosphoribosylanthranilate isomerase
MSFFVPTVKICGLQTAAEIAVATEAGADAVGFVEAPFSPRAVTARRVRRLVGRLPTRVVAVGVFVDRSPTYVARWCREARVHAVQLSGREIPTGWVGFEVPILRTISVAPRARAEIVAWADAAAAFVLDHYSGPGGTGLRVDDRLAAALAGEAPCLLAGGLDPSNVAAAVRAVRPLGVDASSRLESRPGRKDPERVRRFVDAARRALEEVRV